MDNTSANGKRACRVLLAEDDPLNVMLAEQVLQLFGCEVQVVNTGAAAVEAVRAQDFDVLLMDYQMPVMNGLEATRAIRQWEASEHCSPVRIIALTASAMPHQLEQCRHAGMDEIVTKPFDVEVLRRALGRACDPAHGTCGGMPA